MESDRFRAIQEDTQEELEKAEPVFKEEEEALQLIKTTDISEIAGYATPSHLIRRIIDRALILRKLKRIHIFQKNKERALGELPASYDEAMSQQVALKQKDEATQRNFMEHDH
jgi:hypothetical protein